MKRRLAALALLLGFACEAPAPPPSAPHPVATTLDATTAARVGDVAILTDRVARIAAAQSIPIAEARDLAVRDALFAAEARAQGIDADRQVELVASGILARTLVQEIAASAEAQGPVTDAELDEVTERHWTELDRPDASRTVHAVVQLKKGAPADVRAAALALAEAIRKAIAPAADAAQHSEPVAPDPHGPDDPVIAVFRKSADEVPKGALDVRVEALAAVVADGRTLNEGQRYDEAFAKAALQLTKRGDVSPVIETPFGFHVLLLLERIPGHTVPREERRAMVREEVLSTRARAAKDQLLAGLRQRASIDRSVDAALALVPVDR